MAIGLLLLYQMTIAIYSGSQTHEVKPTQREAAARLHPKPLSLLGEACPELVEGLVLSLSKGALRGDQMISEQAVSI
ncbi:hypothetical protein NIES39_D01530 [Arthrospira platensis NIES-39]|nr:hypothetical protein [Limnospira sp. PMC 289.06]QQW30652.1 hypothetical protein AP9108_08265 [Arthrospira sp. PCC 9108]BAI89573.1 hypothetical protein NIES39_D01530 [Arthrospira platensis NIES-39]